MSKIKNNEYLVNSRIKDYCFSCKDYKLTGRVEDTELGKVFYCNKCSNPLVV